MYPGEKVYAVISHVTNALNAAESNLNELDNLAGDGDCGTTLSRGASGTSHRIFVGHIVTHYNHISGAAVHSTYILSLPYNRHNP